LDKPVAAGDQLNRANQPMFGNELTEHPANRAIVLRNVNCPYCGNALDKKTSTKEHVVGRRFVPKGKLHAQWNLIFNACQPCNNRKADLEDDIAAITLQPDLSGETGHGDAEVTRQAQARAKKSISRRTRKPVEDSRENIEFSLPLGIGVTANFEFTAPAQSDEARLLELARLHLIGFFYMLTFKPEERRGYYWPGGYHPVNHCNRGDWGNPQITGFAEAVVNWEPRLMASTALGFFKCCIRRHPNADCWSWALEWNQNARIVGFFGDRDSAQTVVNSLPPLSAHRISLGEKDYLGFRTETPLNGTDLLFHWDGPVIAED